MQRGFFSPFHKLYKNFIDILFPIRCINCGKFIQEDTPVCKDCLRGAKIPPPPICRKCGLPISGGLYCDYCKPRLKEIYYEYIRSAYVYEGVIRNCIHQFKYRGREYIGDFLGGLLANFISKFEETKSADMIIPVPLHWFKKWKRGYNQAELLARPLLKKLGINIFPNVLFRKKYTKAQFSLSRIKRLSNVKDAFEVKDRKLIKGKRIILIDDVATTGETINQCAMALKKSKAKEVYCFTLARDI